VCGVVSALDNPFDYEIINLGNSHTEELMHFVELIENRLGKKAEKNMLPMQPGDVKKTYADISKAKRLLDFSPKINVERGINNFIDWYLEYFKN
jgi:UDP-glucuronate 4-epimerase